MRQSADTEWKEDAAREARSKKISMTEEGGRQWWKEGEEVGGEQQPKEWCMWTASFMEVWKIIITTGFDRSGSWSLRWEVPQGWSVVGGGGVEEGSEHITNWVRPEDGKKSKPWENTRLHKHNTTNDTSTKQPTPTKIGTATDENRKTMTPTQDEYAWLSHSRADGCNLWGVGWSKKKKKKREGSGEWEHQGLKQQTAKWHWQDNTKVCRPTE